MQPKKRKNHDKMRAKIIAAAEHIVRHKGFAALSTRNLASAAEMSVGTIYNYFRDSHELVFVLNSQTILLLTEMLKTTAAKGPVPPKVLIEAYFSFVEREDKRWRMLFEYFPPRGYKIPAYYSQAIEGAVAQAQAMLAQGLQALPLDARRDVTIGLWAMLHGLSMLDQQGKLGRVSSGQSLRQIALATLNAATDTLKTKGQ